MIKNHHDPSREIEARVILPVARAKDIAAGRVTRAFIPVRKPQTVKRSGARHTTRTGLSATYVRQPWTPTIGKTDTVQARVARKDGPGFTVPTFAHVTIIGHDTLRLDALLDGTTASLKAVRAAGHRTIAGFCDDWMCRFDKHWPPVEEKPCPHCDGYGELTDEGVPAPDGVEGVPCPDCDVGMLLLPADVDDVDVVARFRDRYGSTQVWEVIFELDRTDEDRWLSPTSKPRGDDLGYTNKASDAMIDAGVCVPEYVQARFADDARLKRRKAADIETLNERQQLEALIRQMESRSADVRVVKELRLMRSRLRRINAMLTDAA